MLPTLAGRLQTRIFALLVIGGVTQLWLTPLLPAISEYGLAERYKMTFSILVATAALGLVWELLYHFLMQFRWEKDWPTLFGLVTVVNEGAVVWFLARGSALPFVDEELPLLTFVVDFLAVWLSAWVWVNGPMRVFSIHWRFRGGRLI